MGKRERWLTVVFGFALLLALSSTAGATFTTYGSPEFIGSNWLVSFNESGVGNFNSIEVDASSSYGGWFKAGSTRGPLSEFSVPGWSAPIKHVNHDYAFGPMTNDLSFKIFFDGPPTGFIFNAWESIAGVNTLKESVFASWDGNNWSYEKIAPVPIPGAVWLLGSGIVGLIGLKRRVIKRNENGRV